MYKKPLLNRNGESIPFRIKVSIVKDRNIVIKNFTKSQMRLEYVLKKYNLRDIYIQGFNSIADKTSLVKSTDNFILNSIFEFYDLSKYLKIWGTLHQSFYHFFVSMQLVSKR